METYSRFIFQKSHFNRNPPRIKPDAFVAAPNDRTSVYRTDSFEESEIWGIGRELETLRGRELKGRGDLTKQDITDCNFGIEKENNAPVAPDYHYNIIGWATTDKEAQLLKAIDLANKAIPVFL